MTATATIVASMAIEPEIAVPSPRSSNEIGPKENGKKEKRIGQRLRKILTKQLEQSVSKVKKI